MIYIGHPAYNGVNAYAVFDNPADAGDELVRRGVGVRDARRAVISVREIYRTLSAGHEVVEVRVSPLGV